MKTIRTIIVDDESLALDLLRAYLSRYPQVEIIAECQNGRQAIAKANELQPDLMFLDIQMPELTGFDVIEKHTSGHYAFSCVCHRLRPLRARGV